MHKESPVAARSGRLPAVGVRDTLGDGMKPVVQAFLIADQVYCDRTTGKKVIAGTFNSIATPSFPIRHDSCTAFLSLTDVKGDIALQLQFRNLKTNEVIASFDVEVSADDPRHTIEGVFPIHGLIFPVPGVYAADIVYKDEIVGSLRISAIEAQ